MKVRFIGHGSELGSRRLAVLCGATLMLSAGLVQATPLNLNLNPFPDFPASMLQVNYVAGTMQFTSIGFVADLNDDGTPPPEPVSAGTYNVSATIDNAGNLIGGGLNISGTIPTLGFNSGTLLTGNFTAFGFGGANDPLEFLFDVTGGDAAGLFGPVGGTIISGSHGFSGSFASDFSSTSLLTTRADTGSVPEPSTWLLLSIGLVAGLRRRRT